MKFEVQKGKQTKKRKQIAPGRPSKKSCYFVGNKSIALLHGNIGVMAHG